MKPLSLLSFLLILLTAAVAHAQDRESYMQELHQLDVAVKHASAATGSERDQAVRQARDTLTHIEQAGAVETTSGPVKPYLEPIRASLATSPPDLARASRAVDELLATLEMSRVSPTRPGAQAALAEVLRDPRFAAHRSLTWQQRIWQEITSFLRRLLSGLPFGKVGSRALSLTQVVVIVLSLAVGLAVLFFTVRSGWNSMSRRLGEGADPVPRRQDDSAHMFALARASAQAGDYRLAVRAEFIALLLYLHEHGKLRYERSLTNREHLSRIGEDTPLANSLEPLVRVFDDVWYGNQAIDPQGYERYERRAEAIRAGVT